MAKVERKTFESAEHLDLKEHHSYYQQILEDNIDCFDAENHLPPRWWGKWPTAAEWRAAAAKEPDPMIAINAMRRRLNPDPFSRFRKNLHRPKFKNTA